MAELTPEIVARETEVLLKQLFDYTDTQIAELWEQQVIPNHVINGQRVADFTAASAFLTRLWREKQARAEGRDRDETAPR